MNPITPAGPNDDDSTWNNPITKPAIPAEPRAIKNGNLYFKLTPNMAGSVIPSMAEAPADDDSARNFSSFLAKKNTANAAAPWATFETAAIGKMKSPPVLVISASNVVSIAGKLWCNPVTTIAE